MILNRIIPREVPPLGDDKSSSSKQKRNDLFRQRVIRSKVIGFGGFPVELIRAVPVESSELLH